MTKFKKIHALAVAATILFASCATKDNNLTTTDYTGPIQVNFNNYQNDNGDFGFVKAGLPIKDEFVTFNIEVKLSNTTDPAPTDIAVYLTKVDAVVAEYNTTNGTTYSPVSSGQTGISFDLTQPLIIKKGARVGAFPIKINTAKLGFASQWAVGLGILKANGAEINDLQSKLLLDLTALNAYDGYYQTKGAAYHPTYGNYAWNSNGVFACGSGFALTTAGQYSVDLNPGQPLQNGTNLSYFSAVVPRFTVNPTTNKVTITSTIGTTIFVDYPSYDSHYDPATKTFFVKYGWSTDRVATDTFTFCGPR